MPAIKSSTLSSLATFEVTARFSSFTKAAEHLHITTGAVSQQIRQLELQLNFPLFNRHSRGIMLTEQGQMLFDVVHQSLTDIQTMIAKLQQPTAEGEIRLKLTPSFAYKWLVPRLQDFYQQHPEIKIRTFAEGALVDHREAGYDLVIDYCRQPHNKGVLLLPEGLQPVMSPEYEKRFNWNDPACWRQVTLLHDAMPWRDARPDFEWRYWFENMNLKADSEQGHYFNRTDMAMAAAEAGLGVAMARCALLKNDLTSGKLVSPFAPVSANAGYYLISHHHNNAIECFIEWLQKSAEACSPFTSVQ
ncbi:Glycine cleavage system transcriptional activator [Photobacterium marinum]|uniref:Glycine cleavage system transcriptional activator n=1 Tax=Photobacterium marinum TaxID=1056511 RepID=L8JGT5_9GAMM|nr:LysR substrate-binding domain-containing protein [Photobacterium marinum]ELR66632.1 Glycine cleavage system transcriptional activator [Photobacterium marinum]